MVLGTNMPHLLGIIEETFPQSPLETSLHILLARGGLSDHLRLIITCSCMPWKRRPWTRLVLPTRRARFGTCTRATKNVCIWESLFLGALGNCLTDRASSWAPGHIALVLGEPKAWVCLGGKDHVLHFFGLWTVALLVPSTVLDTQEAYN
jgi:hypothetical protein